MNPRQTILLSMDVYQLLAEIMPGESGVIIDGGANVGEATRALRRHFPGAAIHAFEPVAQAFAELEHAAHDTDAIPHRLALGDRPGTTTINVNKNLWTCSLLDANDRGHAFHADWCETVRREEVSVVRLDEWARDRTITELAILKLDLQGFELPALRGAGDLLATCKAIYSEAQISPEYVGASTFPDLDAFLRSHGFGLYQIADLCLKGLHAEPSCCDALWLRRDILDRVRAGTPPRSLDARGNKSARLADALDLCAKHGLRRVAIYGAGAHTVAAGAALADPPIEVVGMIDDHRAGSALWGIPVVSPSEARRLNLDAIVISSDRMEEQILSRCTGFLDDGVCIVTLYEPGGPRIVQHSAITQPGALT